MPKLMEAPPYTPVKPVTEILHGVSITDPYRWLEDQESYETRAWIAAQNDYARSWLDSISGRDRIRERVRELLDVETYDSILRVGNQYFFRKRLVGYEQPCIFSREGLGGEDRLLVDPVERGTGKYTSVKPLQVSPDGRFLLYEVKQGGERTGEFEIFNVKTKERLPDRLSRGYLRGFAFAPDGYSFFYVHEHLAAKEPAFRAARQHFLGTPMEQDREIFRVAGGKNVRLTFSCDRRRILFAVYRFLQDKISDFYLKELDDESVPRPIALGINYLLAPQLAGERILAVTNHQAPNRRIVEMRLDKSSNLEWSEIVSERDMAIHDWLIAGTRIFICYATGTHYQIHIFDSFGRRVGEIPVGKDETVRLIKDGSAEDEVLLETESFVSPIAISCYSTNEKRVTPLLRRRVPFEPSNYAHVQVQFVANDGTAVPMFLVGRHEVLEREGNPAVMTAYGGFAKSMTPQFSVFVAFLMERGCLFALPNIRGGLEMGASWHEAAKRHNRARAVDDFLNAAEWLVGNKRTSPEKLAIFGGSNSGLLVGAAIVRRPDLFRVAICVAPLLDMLRYHLFDSALLWAREFGSSDDPEDFLALSQYSPYHFVKKGVPYPAVMLVSGDADQNCNPLHARKMTARLQEASSSNRPIILDYSAYRGHSAVLPLSTRVEALTDRLAFLCSQLQLPELNGDCRCG